MATRDEEQQKVGAWVPRKLVRQLQRKAKANGRTLSSEVRLALAAWANGKDTA